MKKNMLIAILIATFFSCTEVLDELNSVGIDPKIVQDSLASKIGNGDTTIVEDTTIINEDTVVNEEPPATEILGNSYTRQELEIWRERSQSGQFSENWGRIVTNANTFLKAPDAEIWSHNLAVMVEQPAGTGITAGIVKPVKEGIRLRDAAFYFLITEDVKFGTQVKTTLLKQISDPSVNFANRTMWPTNIGSQPPMFQIAEWVTTLLHTYEYSKSMFNESEAANVEQWFHNAGKFFNENIDNVLDKLFVDRKNGNYTLSGYATATHTNASQKYKFYTHVGGHSISPVAAWNYQNRQASQMRTVAEVGFLVGDETLKKSAYNFVKEAVMFWAYPDGLTTEFERGFQEARPEAGYYYTWMSLDILLNISDLFARHGDMSLFDFKTSKGWFGTEGGEKSLWKVANTLCKIKNKEFYDELTKSNKIYSVAKQEQYLIDAYDPYDLYSKVPLIYIKEIYLAQYNIYFNDPYIKDTYMKAFNNVNGIRIAGSGPHHNDQGVWGVNPSKTLMYWDMEGTIWPFSGNIQ